MADLKVPELNCVVIAGNLTKDPVFRKTTHGTPVISFTIAVNREKFTITIAKKIHHWTTKRTSTI